MKSRRLCYNVLRAQDKDVYMVKKKLTHPTLTTMNVPIQELDNYFRVSRPYSEHEIEQIGLKLIRWASESDDALKLSSFATENHMAGKTLRAFAARNKIFSECYQEAKRIIGDRREIGGLRNKLNHAIVLQSMVKYDDSWRQVEEWRSKLKQKQEELDASKKIIVQMQDYQIPQGYKLVKETEK